MKGTLVKATMTWADENRILLPETAVVAGISGGADSVCLLHVLKEIKEMRAFTLIAVHINHMLRDEESMGDEAFVRELCHRWEIPLQVFREDVRAFSQKEGCSLEEAGRIVRYERFEQVRKETGAEYIAVAHHSDDQAETVFLNLLRGSGLSGLCGMEEIYGAVIRPLLKISKEQILSHLEEHGIPFRTDSSNTDNTYIRNAVRNSLFPAIQKETGFPLHRSLVRTASLLQSDRDYLEQAAESQYHSLVLAESDHVIILNRMELIRLHPAIYTRVIRMAWEKLTDSRKGIEAKHVEAVYRLAKQKGTGKTIELPRGIRAVTEYDKLRLGMEATTSEPKSFMREISVPSIMKVEEANIQITACIYTRDEYIKKFGIPQKSSEKSLTQLFDYKRINKGINIRNRLPGDVFFPYHGSGKKKLKDFFIDGKIAADKRSTLPLIAEGCNILWILGMRTSEQYKITRDTDTILLIEAERLNLPQKPE